jgi:hypothetical protein
MRLIAEHKTDIMVFTEEDAQLIPDVFGNVIQLREDNVTEDFNYALQTPNFEKKSRNPIAIEMFFNNGSGERKQREVVDHGGPKMAAVTTMLEKFAYPRLKQLSANGTVISPTFGFSPDDWNTELLVSGKIAGTFFELRFFIHAIITF